MEGCILTADTNTTQNVHFQDFERYQTHKPGARSSLEKRKLYIEEDCEATTRNASNLGSMCIIIVFAPFKDVKTHSCRRLTVHLAIAMI